MRVVVLGASNKPERYSNKAVKSLLAHGHEVVPVHPALNEIEGLAVKKDLDAVTGPVDTLTLYIAADKSSALEAKILSLSPRRVIFNPGAENGALEAALRRAGIETLQACTLVLLSTQQF